MEGETEEEVLSHNLQDGIKAIRAFAASGQTSFGKFVLTFGSREPEVYAKIRDYIPGMWLNARKPFPEIEKIDEDGAKKVLEEVDLQVRVMNDHENHNEAPNLQSSLKMARDPDDNRGGITEGGFVNKNLIDADSVKNEEAKFEMKRRMGTFCFLICFFLACCFFVESNVARFVIDAIATIVYWKWADGLDAPVNYKVNDYEMRYHRAVIRVEKLTTFNSTLLLIIFALLALCWVGRWVDGPSMCNPNCHWCKERIAQENEPDDSYNPQGRE